MSQHKDAKGMECKDNVFLKSFPVINDMFTLFIVTAIMVYIIS